MKGLLGASLAALREAQENGATVIFRADRDRLAVLPLYGHDVPMHVGDGLRRYRDVLADQVVAVTKDAEGDWHLPRRASDLGGALRLTLAELAELPAPWTVRLRGDGGEVVWTTSRAEHQRARDTGVPAFVGRELAALDVGARADRLTPQDLARWCERKRAEPTWRLSARGALAGARGRVLEERIPAVRVAEMLGLLPQEVE